MFRMITLVLVVLMTSGFQAWTPTQTTRPHDEWLLQRYLEALSIKEGMTRAELLRVFGMDGGLQSLLPTRYVLKSSNIIKVDVEFEVPEGVTGNIVPEDLRAEMEAVEGDSAGTSATNMKYQLVKNEKLKIKTISRPYLEQFSLD